MRLPTSRTEAVARACFGEPNRALSTRTELRWGTHGSLAFKLSDGVWFDHESGHGGGVFDAVIFAGLARCHKEAAQWLEREGWLDPCRNRPSSIQHTPRKLEHPKPGQVDEQARLTKARVLWEQALPLEQTLGERYLIARAINPPWLQSLRFHPALWCADAGRRLPALIAAITPLQSADDIRAVQRTWLQEPGRKADVPTPKKALGSFTGCGVVLAPFHSRLLIAEGVETALSAGDAWGTSAVASLGASNMAALIVPAYVKDVLIAFDRDGAGTGERAAVKLATRLHAEGRTVTLTPAPSNYKDWNDFAQAQSREADHG